MVLIFWETLREFKQKIKKEIEKLTTMNVQQITIVAKGIHMLEPEELQKIEEKNIQQEDV